MVKLRKKVFSGIRWLVLKTAGVRLVSFVVLLVLVRLLEPAAFGLLALAALTVEFLQMFVVGGLTSAIVQRKVIEDQHLDTAFWANIVVAALAVTGLWLLADSIASLFGEPELGPVIKALSFLLVISGLTQVQVAILQRKLAFRFLAVRDLVAVPIGGVVGVSMAFAGFGVWSLVGRSLSKSLTKLILLWAATRWFPGLAVTRRHFSELFSFGASMLGYNMLTFVSRRSADLVIGYFLGATALGYFNVGSRFARMLTKAMAGTLGAVAWPAFSRLQDDITRLRKVFDTAGRSLALVVWPCFVGLSLLSADLVPIVFGTKWLPSVPVMQVVAFFGLLRSITLMNDNVMVALGKPNWRLYLQTATTITVISGLVVVADSGIVNVAVWYVTANFLFLPISVWMTYRLIGDRPMTYLQVHAVPVAGSIVMAILVGLAKVALPDMGSSINLVVLTTLGALVYVGMVWLTAPEAFASVMRIFRELAHVRRMPRGRTP